MKYKIIFVNVIFVLSLLPYITPVNLPFDVQPWALILGITFLFILYIKKEFDLSTTLKFFLLLFIYSIFVLLFGFFTNKLNLMNDLRSSFGYLSVFVFSFISLNYFKLFKKEYFIGVILLLLGVSIIQLFLGLEVVSPFLSRFSGGGSRGVTSLTSEPAFYSLLCLSLMILNEIFFNIKKYNIKVYFFILLILILQIVLSYSAVGIMFLSLFGIGKFIEIFIIKNNQVKLLDVVTILIILFSIFLFSNKNFLGDKRAGEILKQSFSAQSNVASDNLSAPANFINPLVEVATNNLSVSRRLLNPLVAFYGGVIATKGVGVGLSDRNLLFTPSWASKFMGEGFRLSDRIEGGVVSAVYNFGLVGILYLVFILILIYRSVFSVQELRTTFIISSISFLGPMLIFGTIAFPLFGCIMGIHLYYLDKMKI